MILVGHRIVTASSVLWGLRKGSISVTQKFKTRYVYLPVSQIFQKNTEDQIEPT